MSALARLIATWFYLGYAPVAPGTFGSAGAILVALPLVWYAGFTPWMFAALAIVLLPVAIWSADRIEGVAGKKDPGLVVVDEVVGQWITLAGAASFNWKVWLLAFFLFRAFDVLKPPPAAQMERIKGGAGIVLDDVMAGLYAALVLWAAGWFNSSSVFLYGSS